ncbi:ROK family transcriptional regulator [Olivibacter sp. XZL3]|uniref:ROK family transcriptional regulator n=1 Tax=Olivibacter sp. XZL3 TaxID=1735116 RepID=UPI001066B833|nr:ROK family transcriptional regulator [Olivibacter sp. XZL3]
MEERPKKQHALKFDILRYLYYRGPMAINELSKLTGKSLPLITTHIHSLKEQGLIINNQYAQSTGGRRAHEYQLNKESGRYIIAVSVDQLVTRIAAFNLHNEQVDEPKEKAINLEKAEESLSDLVNFIKGYIKELPLSISDMLGIGIAMPGFVNAEKGINNTHFGLGERSLADYIAKEVGCEVFIDNDSSAIALAELNFGAARGMQDVMVVNVGWGIGLGMIVNGKLFRGHSGFAGEFSHIPLADSNNLCVCGKRGCLEVDASLLVLTKRAQKEMKNGYASKMEGMFSSNGASNLDIVLNAANAGDQLAVNLLSKAGFLIGKGIATLIHIMNPQGVVVSGRGAIASRILMAPIQQAVNEFSIPMLAEQCTILPSPLNKEAELLGAATLVMERTDKFFNEVLI